MKHTGTLVASRALARHCPELVSRGPSAEDLAARLDQAAAAVARALGAGLAPLTGGIAPRVTVQPARTIAGAELAALVPGLAACALLETESADLRVLSVIDAGAVLRMVDRTFGGRGEAPSPLPEAFPVSSALLIGRLEQALCAALAAGLGETAPRLSARRRGERLAELPPFGADRPLSLVTLEVVEADGRPWQVLVVIPFSALSSLFAAAPARAANTLAAPVDPLAEPFGSLPLSLSAVLVDMRLPMAVVAGFQPGMVVPVAVARKVPLRLGETLVATGTVGAADDRVAIQITEIMR